MNKARHQSSVRILTEVPENYRKERLISWDANSLLWTRYIDSETQQTRTDMLNRLTSHVVRMASDMRTPPSIIDVGCGEALFLRLCVQPLPDALLTGLDFSEAMLEQARLRSPLMRVSFKEGDIEDPSLDLEGRYDIAVSTLTLDEIEDLDTAFRNISKALNPRGRALIVVLDPYSEVLRHQQYMPDGDTLAEPDQGRLLLILKHFRVDHQISPAPYSRIVRAAFDYINAAKKAGLKLDNMEKWSLGSLSPDYIMGPMLNVMFFSQDEAV